MDGVNLAQVGMGAIFFFLLMAILSVPLCAATLSHAIKGLLLAEPEMRMKYKVIIIITASMNALFIPAIMRYEWLNASTLYDSAYHMIGYFGNIVMLITTSTLAKQDRVAVKGVFLLAMACSIGYLMIVPMLDLFMNFGDIGVMLIGFGYAAIQFIIPGVYWIRIYQNNERYAADRMARLAAEQQRYAARYPVVQPPVQPVTPLPQESTPQPFVSTTGQPSAVAQPTPPNTEVPSEYPPHGV